MADKFNAGFVRDEQGRLALSTAPAKEGWISGFVRDEEGRLVVTGPEGAAIGGVTTGEVAPAKFAKGALYIQVEGGKSIAIWEGRGASEEPINRVDLSGTPADGSVTAAKVAAANIDGAAGTPSMRSLSTGSLFDAAATDTQTPSRKAVETALGLLAGRYRNLLAYGTKGATTAAAAATKYFTVAASTEITQIVPGETGSESFYPIQAASLAVTGLTTKLRLVVAYATPGAAPAVTYTFALYKVTQAANATLGAVVAGSELAIAGPAKEKLERVETADFDIPEDGVYAIGFTVSGTPSSKIAFPSILLQTRNV